MRAQSSADVELHNPSYFRLRVRYLVHSEMRFHTTTREVGPIRHGLAALGCAAAVAVAGYLASVPAHAMPMPRLLIFSALAGSPAQVKYRPSHFAVNHYSVSQAHWNVWDSTQAVTSASVLEEFPAAQPRRIRATVKLTRPAYRCGVYTFTRLLVDGGIVSALDAYSGICNWVVT